MEGPELKFTEAVEVECTTPETAGLLKLTGMLCSTSGVEVRGWIPHSFTAGFH